MCSMELDRGDSERPDVLLPTEIEAYVDALESSTFEELGSVTWLEKHDRVEKLTIQAIVQALSEREETVKDLLISREKIKILIHDIILTELWREDIFPELLSKNPKCSFGLYTIIYHEATCINLIETIMFHPESMETLGDTSLDLLDYCFRAISWLIANGEHTYDAESDHLEMDLIKQSNSLLFRISFKALTCLRYIIENIDKIQSSIVPRLVVSGDAPMLLTDIILKKPWLSRNAKTGQEMIYDADEQRWTEFSRSKRFLIGKTDGQAWLALYQLLKHERVISTYEIHNYRKNQLLKLQSLLNEAVLDQIPVLGEFQRWLCEISLSSGTIGPSKSPLILEMMPPIRTALQDILKETRSLVLNRHIQELVTTSDQLMSDKAKRLCSSYDIDTFEAALPKPSKCASCGAVATKRCGNCRNEWYCKRECQVKHWSKHKINCGKNPIQS